MRSEDISGRDGRGEWSSTRSERLVEVEEECHASSPSLSPKLIGPMTQAPALERLPTIPSFVFSPAKAQRPGGDVSPETWSAVQRGEGIQHLIDTCPEDVITVLKNWSIIRLGTLYATVLRTKSPKDIVRSLCGAKDLDVLQAFGTQAMLTRGAESVDDPHWPREWRERIKTDATHATSRLSVGWKEKVTLGAYVVNLRDIADRDKGAILRLLLRKHSSGAASKKIWEFQAVKAVINYHWQHWARRFIMLSFVAFLCWLTCYVIFMILYIDHDIGSSIVEEVPFHRMSTATTFSHLFNLLAFIFMFPTVAELGLSIHSQRWKFFQPRNLLDLAASVLQCAIFVSHLSNQGNDGKVFKYALVAQCVLLFTNVQKFSWMLGNSTFLTDVIFGVMYDVRYLLLYLLYSTISAGLCLGVLFKDDEKFSKSEDADHFSSFLASMVTTVQIVFGTFELGYILSADEGWIKFTFFFIFQVLMMITVLNLLIAVMTESYAKVAADLGIKQNIGRAEAIDKLDTIGVSRMFLRRHPPFIHFLVVDRPLGGSERAMSVSIPSSGMTQELQSRPKSPLNRNDWSLADKLDAYSRQLDEQLRQLEELRNDFKNLTEHSSASTPMKTP